MSQEDRLTGLVGYSGVKVPVRVASTANIAALSGLLTIDGVVTVQDDRVLVKNQTSSIDNGIYVADSGDWERAQDADGPYDFVQGSLVGVYAGTANAGTLFQQTTASPVAGTSALTFASYLTLGALPLTIANGGTGQAAATAAFAALAAEALAFTGDISPTALSANTDNWAPTGFSTASTIRISSNAAWNLTGIAAGTDGRTILLHNVGAFTITLKDDVTSTAANRFQLSADYALAADQSVMLEYDSTSSRWRVLGQQSAASSTTTTVPGLLENVGLAVTMAANAVTIALKGADGNDPSATNLVGVSFRNATITTGTASKVQASAAISTVISSGSTGGTVSATAGRIWIGAILTGGAIELAWFNARSGVSIAPINEGGLISTTAEGGAGGADSAQTWYSTTARANVPVTILGYFDATEATAGTWATAASAVVVNPKYRPRDVIQEPRTDSGAVATGTTALPRDDTIPQITEGDQFMTQAITPIAAANVLEVEAQLALSMNGAAGLVILALFQDATAGALAVASGWDSSAEPPDPIRISFKGVAAGVASTTFRARAGNNGGNTTTFNGAAAARYFGGVMNSFMQVKEIVA